MLRGEGISRADVFDVPVEQIIAEGRIILVALALGTIALAPDLLAPSGTQALAVVAAYAGLAVAQAAIRIWRFPGWMTGYAVHALDVGFLLALGALTEARISPLFALFMFFVLLAASLRWNWQAVVATAGLLALAIWGASAVQAARTGAPDAVGSSMPFVRGLYVLMAGAMLAYSSAVRERRREQLTRLTQWPGPDPAQTQSPSLANMLAHCAAAIEAPRVLVLWEEAEEPFVNVAIWQRGEYAHTREMAGAFGNFVRSRQQAGCAFWTDDAASTFAAMPEGPVRLDAPIVDDTLIKVFGIRSVASAPFTGISCSGRVFILDRDSWSGFQLQLIQIIGSRIGNALDRQIMQSDANEAAAERERTRLTRDLHDGLLQSLTAAGLQIKLLADGANGETRTRLEMVRQLLAAEQRRVRDFVRKAPSSVARDTDVPLGLSLTEALSEIARHWDCAASLTVDPPEATVPATLCVHLSLMLAEAIANAVRHGHASSVRVAIKRSRQDVTVHVRDDGHGFNGAVFSHSDRDLAEAGVGPFSLRDRVRELGGLLGVASSPAGVDLQIQLPLT
jgi:signal transduction histidine kinase